jgi:hypothetical protein
MHHGATAPVMAGIHDNAVHPSRKPSVRAKGAQFHRQGRKYILTQVFGLFPTPTQTERKPEDTIIMPRNQAGKSISVSTSGGAGQGIVRGFHTHHDCYDARQRSILGEKNKFFQESGLCSARRALPQDFLDPKKAMQLSLGP